MAPERHQTAVIFSSQRVRHEHADTDGYTEMSEHMEELARRQPGFVSIDSARDRDGFGITVSYWDSDEAARAWKEVAAHLEAQRLGRDRWYDSYQIRIADVGRSYRWRRPDTVLHIALPGDWLRSEAAGSYTISTRGVSLEQEGFIHCSYDHQAEGVANRFYADLSELLLLRVALADVESEVVVEPPFLGAPEAFPHIYGPIPAGAVIGVTPWLRVDGEPWTLPAGLA